MVSPVLIRPLLAIIVTAVLIGIVATIYRSGSHDQPPVQSALQQLPQNIDIALNKARFSEIRGGSVVWELLAEHVEYDKSADVAHLSGIQMDFARSKTSGTITVTAEHGDYFTNSNDIRLNGKVHVQTEDGISFDTDTIEYSAIKSRFKTLDKISFRQQRLSLTAVGMEMDVKSQRVNFNRAIDAVVAGSASQRTAPPSTLKKPVRNMEKHVVKEVKMRRKGKK